MAIRIGDPDEIRKFAAQLQAYSRQSKDGLKRLQAKLDQLGTTSWRDQSQRDYKNEFDPVVLGLLRNLEQFEQQQNAKLRNLAAQYENVRYGR